MFVIKNYVAPSTIHGNGAFAAEPITAGTLVWRFDERLDLVFTVEAHAKLDPVIQDFIRSYGYLDRDLNVYIVSADNSRFINHSPSPNLVSRGREDFAIRDIAAGEEILSDYNEFDLIFTGKNANFTH
ncbi:MAG: SET domain-containing protein [Spirochaetales bacterium]|nr:SET domain-containing protein [Spirochaetales bacterium]